MNASDLWAWARETADVILISRSNLTLAPISPPRASSVTMNSLSFSMKASKYLQTKHQQKHVSKQTFTASKALHDSSPCTRQLAEKEA